MPSALLIGSILSTNDSALGQCHSFVGDAKEGIRSTETRNGDLQLAHGNFCCTAYHAGLGGLSGRGSTLTLGMLLTVACASLVLISGVDDNCYRFFALTAPSWKFVPALRITSLTACGILCFAFGRHSMCAPLPTTPWRTVIIASGSWLCGSILALFVFHVWTPLLPSWIDVSSFLRGAPGSETQRALGDAIIAATRATMLNTIGQIR